MLTRGGLQFLFCERIGDGGVAAEASHHAPGLRKRFWNDDSYFGSLFLFSNFYSRVFKFVLQQQIYDKKLTNIRF